MVFARRKRRSLGRRILEAVWPSAGFRRSAAYFARRVTRLKASPHAIAAGFAAGAAASCFPLIGLHFLLSFALAWIARGSMIAAALGTAVGNPLTFPFLFASAYNVGALMLGQDAAGEAGLSAASDELTSNGLFGGGLEGIWPVFRMTMIGAAPIALVAFLGFYLLVRWSAARFQEARRRRIAARNPAPLVPRPGSARDAA
jgi:uncharacterized protein (DUF2062 family)